MVTVPRKSAKVWNRNWMRWCGMSYMQNIRLHLPQKKENRPGRNTWISVECSRIFGGEIGFRSD